MINTYEIDKIFTMQRYDTANYHQCQFLRRYGQKLRKIDKKSSFCRLNCQNLTKYNFQSTNCHLLTKFLPKKEKKYEKLTKVFFVWSLMTKIVFRSMLQLFFKVDSLLKPGKPSISSTKLRLSENFGVVK